MNKKIKLLIAVDTYYPKIDGTLKFVEQFVKLAKEDFDLHLLVPNFQNKKEDEPDKTYLSISRFITSSGYSSIKILSWKNFKKIKKAVKEADLVFVQGPALVTMFTIFFSRIYDKKCLFYLHIDPWEFFNNFLVTFLPKLIYHIIKPLFKISLNMCNLVFVPYYDFKARLESKGIKSKIEVARLGVDINTFHPVKDKSEAKKKIKIPANKTVIGYVGRISKEKNTEVLLEAFEKLDNQEDLYLLMVGDGHKNLIDKFKRKNCKVTGFVNNVADYIQAMDVFVMPSLTETTSLATLEAMSCGIPIISSKVGFMKKYIVKNHNGIFFPRNSSTMLAIKIDKLLKNREQMLKLGHNARRTVAYSFSWERSINKIKRIILNTYYK